MNIPRQTLLERWGIFILLMASAAVLYLPSLIRTEPTPLDPEKITEIENIFRRLDSLSELWKHTPISINVIPVDSLIHLGFKASLAHRIVSYRDKAGGFKDARALSKIYGMNDSIIHEMQLTYEGYSGKSRYPDYSSHYPQRKHIKPPKEIIIKPYRIRINHVNEDSLIWLGVPKYMSERIIKYRKIIKNYSTIDDVLKVYGIDTAMVDMMDIDFSPKLIDFAMTEHGKNTLRNESNGNDSAELINYEAINKIYPKIIVNINTASSEELEKIYGIGPAFASRIIAYRDRLGGFHTLEQIKYTPRLHPDGFKALEGHLLFDTEIKPLIILESNREKLLDHPYLGNKQVDKLIELQSVSELSIQTIKDSKIFSDWEWARVGPYFVE